MASKLPTESSVRKSVRVRILKTFYDPSDNKLTYGQRTSSSTNAIMEAPSSSSASAMTTLANANTDDTDATISNNYNRELPTTHGGDIEIPEIPAGDAEACDFNSIKNWTVRDVAKFFGKYYPSVASLFRNHQIDGLALHFIRRQDIFNRFNLRIGPALHIYQLITLLKTKDNQLVCTWRSNGLTFSGCKAWNKIVRLTN